MCVNFTFLLINAIDSLSHESDKTVYNHKPVGSSGGGGGGGREGKGKGREELDIVLHTLHGVNAEFQVWN